MPTIFGEKVVVALADGSGSDYTFNEVASLPTNAQRWNIDDMPGWEDTSDIDVELVPFGGGVDGESIDTPNAAKARHMLISGYVLAPTRAQALELWNTLVRDVFPRNKTIRITRYEPDVTKWIDVRVSSKRERTDPISEGFRFIIPVVAPYPFKFSSHYEQTTGVTSKPSGGRSYSRTYPLQYAQLNNGNENGLSVNNEGTADSYPIITVTGPLAKGGWRIANETTGEYIKYDVALSATDTLVIDFYEEVALLNGASVSNLVVGDFFRIVPGVNEIRLYADYDPAADFTLAVDSAWE